MNQFMHENLQYQYVKITICNSAGYTNVRLIYEASKFHIPE